MFLSFSIENVLSFKNRVTLDFRSSCDITERLDEATALSGFGDLRALKVVGVYGANASGKSNLCIALSGFLSLISHSSDKAWMDEHTVFLPFLFDRRITSIRPMRLELLFTLKKRMFRYGFEMLNGNFTKEWLFAKSKLSDGYEPILMRKDIGNAKGKIEFDVSELSGVSDSMKKLVRHDSLMLSLFRNLNIPLAVDIVDDLCGKTYMGSTLRSDMDFTASLILAHSKLEKQIQEFVRKTDPVIGRIVVKETRSDTGMESLRARKIQIRFQPVLGGVRFKTEGIPFRAIASAGTQKAFEMAGPIFKALSEGGVVVIDEFGSAMHPLLSQSVIRLFNCKETNPNNAQLLFVTHDSNLLATKIREGQESREELLLRPDQVVFVEREEDFSSTLYSQSDFLKGKRARSNRCNSREDRYLSGEFGAIPFFSGFIGGER